jgi:hypothetical protein
MNERVTHDIPIIVSNAMALSVQRSRARPVSGAKRVFTGNSQDNRPHKVISPLEFMNSEGYAFRQIDITNFGTITNKMLLCIIDKTERYDGAVGIPASYSEGQRFKSQLVYRLYSVFSRRFSSGRFD